jgi:23S rRNA (guanosine2251-2'-O)-methyltransferase
VSGRGGGRGKRRPGRGGGEGRGAAGGGRSGGAGGRSSARGPRNERAGSGASGRAPSERPRPGPAGPSGRGSRAGHAAEAPAETILYGRNAVAEALRAGRRRVHRIWATAGAAREPWLAGVRAPIAVVDAGEVERRAGSDAHQGVCAQVDPYPYVDPEALLRGEAPLIVALDEVQDPQNLGAICRTAECVGAAGVVICERRAAQVTAAAAKASAGAVEHLPVARVRNLADFLLEAREAGAWSYGAAGVPSAVPYTEPDWTGAVVLVLGAEGRGLRPRVAAACDALVALPMRGRIGSLNVSAAAAALLYAILQRRDGP